MKGIFDYLWTHALSSDQTHELIEKYCDFTAENDSAICANATRTALIEKGKIDFYNIYAPLCFDSSLKNGSTGSVSNILLCIVAWTVQSNSELYKDMKFIYVSSNQF